MVNFVKSLKNGQIWTNLENIFYRVPMQYEKN